MNDLASDISTATPRREVGFDSDIDSDGLREQKIKLRLYNERYQSDTSDRKWLALWTAFIVSIWLWWVIMIVIFNDKFINLSEAVLITLLGTTTLNVLGLSFIVLRGHFKGDKSENNTF